MKPEIFSLISITAASLALSGAPLFETPFAVQSAVKGEYNRKKSTPVDLDAGGRYMFSFTARRSASGSGTVVTGPGCVNVDWHISDPVAAPRRFVFRVPAGKNPRRETFHLGGWRMTGEITFEAASYAPVKAIWGETGGLVLGHGESVEGNRYSFTTQLGEFARNDSRPLVSHTMGFNSDRWCATGGSHLTYRHELKGRKFRSGKITVRSGWYSRGAVRMEVSADGENWTAAGSVTNKGIAVFDVPAALFPAVSITVRAVGEKNCSLQIHSYMFDGEVDGAPVSAFGSTRYVDAAGTLLEHLRAPVYYDENYGERVAEDGKMLCWRASSAMKIPPRRNPPAVNAPAGEGLVIRTAANEAEAAQIVVCPRTDVEGVCVKLDGDLVSASGGRIATALVDIRRVGYVNITQPTDGTGCRGLWPDPLLPQTDDGCRISAGVNQPFRVRVKPPKGTAKGLYRGTLKVRSSAGEMKVPLLVEVFGFELPDRMTCETAFGFAFSSVCRYHGVKTPEHRRILLDKYLRILSDNHISPYDPAPLSPWKVTWKGLKENPATAEPVFDWTAWDAAVERAFNEYHFNTIRLPVQGLGGGTFHSRREPSIAGYPATNALYHVLMGKYLGAIEAHLREKGWLDKAYVYWFDEPDPKDYDFVKNGFATLKRHAPGLRRMLTEQPEADLVGAPNLWCPLTPNLHTRDEAACRAAGDKFWWYVCCGPKAPYVTEFIDHPGVEMRLWSWQTWKENVQGLLIWATVYWTSGAAYPDSLQDPYEDPMSWVSGYSTGRGVKSAWGNGDGRLVYPPPTAKGGNVPVLDDPVPTIRLEMLADGIEDFEYFTMLKRRLAFDRSGLSARYASLLKVPEAVTKSMTEFSVDPSYLEAHRIKIARALEELGRGDFDGKTPVTVETKARLVLSAPIDGISTLEAGDMKYLETSLPAETIRAAFAAAEIK